VRSQLATDPRTRGIAQAPFERVTGGLSNFSWQAVTHDGAWFVRLARAGSERLGADLANECQVLNIAAAAGVAPPTLRCDPVARLLVTRWVDAATGSAPGARQLEPVYLASLADVMARVHALRVPKGLRVMNFERQAGLLERACRGIDPALSATAATIFTSLRSNDRKLVLCHNDLNPSNIVVDLHGRPWFVDWEYAGMGDPVFDLASCASQHALTRVQCDQLLDRYRQAGGICPATDFLVALWAFDYVQWLWYAAFAGQGVVSERALAGSRAAQLAQTLHERASRLPHCNNQRSASP